MINLYKNDKINNGNLIMGAIFNLDQALDMEKILISSYYSYISFDPEVVVVENGKIIEFERPDIAEEKLANVKEMTMLLLNYRKEKKNKK